MLGAKIRKSHQIQAFCKGSGVMEEQVIVCDIWLTIQVATKPKVFNTRLTVFMLLSKYTAPRTALTVAVTAGRRTTPKVEGLPLMKATRPVVRPMLIKLTLQPTCCMI